MNKKHEYEDLTELNGEPLPDENNLGPVVRDIKSVLLTIAGYTASKRSPETFKGVAFKRTSRAGKLGRKVKSKV